MAVKWIWETSTAGNKRGPPNGKDTVGFFVLSLKKVEKTPEDPTDDSETREKNNQQIQGG